jgi:hypothetical protein
LPAVESLASFVVRKGYPPAKPASYRAPNEDVTYQSSGFSAMEPLLGWNSTFAFTPAQVYDI